MSADPPQVTTSSNGRKRGKLRLLDRSSLDRRTKAAQRFDSIAAGIADDLGGEARLSTVQRHLVEAFAGVALSVNDLNAKLLLGLEVNIIEHAQAISTMVRVASRIGVDRVARDVTPTLADILREGPPSVFSVEDFDLVVTSMPVCSDDIQSAIATALRCLVDENDASRGAS